MLRDIKKNPLMLTDAYNTGHGYLKCNVDWEVSHMYNRSRSMILYGFWETVSELLSIKITKEHIEQAKQCAERMGLVFPEELFTRVVEEFNGYAPIKIEALPEGTWCPTGTPFAQIRNTAEGFGELVTWWEGILTMSYFPCNCATEAFEMRKYLEKEKLEGNYDDSFYWRFHNFGFRGSKSLEDAYWAGTAWNLFLHGTDDFHTAQHTPEAKIGSVMAMGHKVIQQFDDEYQCFVKAVDTAHSMGKKAVGIIVDTYDAHRCIEKYTAPISRYAKDKGISISIQVDSGDNIEQVSMLYDIMKEHNLDNITFLVGEGMSMKKAIEYDKIFKSRGIPLGLITYGIGAGFYKHLERDTLGFATKTAYSNGKPRMKIVKTNPYKQSIPNIVYLEYDKDGNMMVMDGEASKGNESNLYRTVYEFDGSSEYPTMFQMTSSHYTEVSKRALSQETFQERIKLSNETENRIAEFFEIYK